MKLVREGGLAQILKCCLYEDLEVKRDSVFALANIADSVEFQQDIVREGGIEVLVDGRRHLAHVLKADPINNIDPSGHLSHRSPCANWCRRACAVEDSECGGTRVVLTERAGYTRCAEGGGH